MRDLGDDGTRVAADEDRGGEAADDLGFRVQHAVGAIGDPTLRRATVEAVEAIAWRARPPTRSGRDDAGTGSKPNGWDGDRGLVEDSVRFLTTFASILDPHRRRLALALLDALATPLDDACIARLDRRPCGPRPT